MKFSLDIILVALVAFAQAHPEPVAEDAAIIEERDFPWPGPKPGPKPEPYYPCYKYGKYECTPDGKAIRICGHVSNPPPKLGWRIVGPCTGGNRCAYINGIPYCVKPGPWKCE